MTILSRRFASPKVGRPFGTNPPLFRLTFLIILSIPSLSLLLHAQPERATEGFTFFAIGDAGKPGPVLSGTASAMENEAKRLANGGDSLNAIIFLGDNFYPNGLNLEQKERDTLIEQVIGPHRPLLHRLGRENVFSVAGNHDYYCAMLGPAPYGTCRAGNRYEGEIPEWKYYDGFPASARYPVRPGSSDSVELFFFDSALLLVTDPAEWHPYLDSLETLLQRSAQNPAIRWRFIFAHHSPYSVGAHGGYRKWDSRRKEVLYIGNCIEEGDDPSKYIERLAGYHEDVCDRIYQAYKDSLFAVIDRSKAIVQSMFAGHDHTLQLLTREERKEWGPRVFVVSGAGSKQEPVRSPLPPSIYTHPFNDPEHKGESAYGFVAGAVEGERLHLWFVNGEDGKRLDMGGGSDFYVDQNGLLVQTR